MTDAERVPNPLPAIDQMAPGSGVIFRHYTSNHRLELSHKIKDLCRKRELLFLVAGDIALAQSLNADGLHLPEYLVNSPPLSVRVWRQRPGKLLTAATHSQRSLHKSRTLGVDAALLSPIFPTTSHPESLAPNNVLGSLGLMKMCLNSPVPIYALGGVSDNNARQLLKSPVIGIAGISGIADNGIT
ncbi:MAG: thiamine phosphate synthase [Rhodospirillaceae bacterium]|nr:thiamine phosphate synthase [Rhodospirillaceae bacterium]